MNLKLTRAAVWACLAGALLGRILPAQSLPKQTPASARTLTVGVLLDQFRSPNQSARIQAFYLLFGADAFQRAGAPLSKFQNLETREPSQRLRLRAEVVELLRREQMYVRSLRAPTSSEMFSNYYGDLIWMVAEIRDPRALDVLIEVLPTGHNAALGVVRLGDPALSRLVAMSSSSDAGDRERAARGLSVIGDADVAPYVTAARRAQARTALLRLSSDDSPSTRLFAITGLEREPPDPQIRAVFARLAKDSSDCTVVGGKPLCPVQRVAKQWQAAHPERP
jgi:hypothetical protein